jgi:hypothetical protein
MADIIGWDPITGEAIWDDQTMNPPTPEPLPTQDPAPVYETPEQSYDIAVYMFSTDTVPEYETLPAATHQGIQLTDPELFQVVTSARWAAESNFTTHAVVLLVVDDDDPATAPLFDVDLSASPVKISSAK